MSIINSSSPTNKCIHSSQYLTLLHSFGLNETVIFPSLPWNRASHLSSCSLLCRNKNIDNRMHCGRQCSYIYMAWILHVRWTQICPSASLWSLPQYIIHSVASAVSSTGPPLLEVSTPVHLSRPGRRGHSLESLSELRQWLFLRHLCCWCRPSSAWFWQCQDSTGKTQV